MAQMKRIMVRVPADLHRAVKIKAVTEDRTVSGVIREFLAEWVGEMPVKEEQESVQMSESGPVGGHSTTAP